MSVLDDLVLVNYCYPDCTPLMNIMRLPEAEAIRFAHALAESHPIPQRFTDLQILRIITRAEKNKTSICIHALLNWAAPLMKNIRSPL